MNLFASLMRTGVPLLAGWILTAAGALGISADSQTVAGAVSLGLAAGYYALFRLLEDVAGRIGLEPLRLVAGALLGWARPPAYAKAAADDVARLAGR